MVPVVDCPNSVCIKAVITEAPAKRDVCGGISLLFCHSFIHSLFLSLFFIPPLFHALLPSLLFIPFF
uniref:Uncharacterized protein n=1 Tax=Angiostrongylus cantonensis TaxID=6313 RepID=A0A0K0DEZ6_ANGCA